MKHLIIGNGIAAINAAGAIRELDTSSEICMVSDETGPPYSRPMISNLLDGSQTPERLPLFTGDIYKDLDISPVLGQRVSRIDVAGKSVRTADGRDIGYDRLLVASGADARRLNVPGSDLGNIFYMRTKADATAQVVALSQSPQNALVLGGGLVGFKAAYGLIKRGIPTTMLITSDYPLAMQVDETAGRMILRALESRGLTVRTGVSVSAFDGETLVRQATLDTGETLDCDYVIVGKGVEPAMDFIPEKEIGTGYGVLVDEYLCAGPDVYVAGDAAEAVDIARQTRWVNAIWPEAAEQGRIAGWNMAGRRVAYPGSLSRNVMRVYDLDIMTLGLANPGDKDIKAQGLEVVRAGDEDAPVYRSLVFRGDIMVGAVLVNRIEQGGVLQALIRKQAALDIPKPRLLSLGFNFSSLL